MNTLPVITGQAFAPQWRAVKNPASLLAPFRYRQLPGTGHVVITSDAGDYGIFTAAEFGAILANEVTPGSALYDRLSVQPLLATDLAATAQRLAQKAAFLSYGPNLHIVITTLRCNQDCLYCHASRTDMSRTETDMSLETAARVLDVIFSTTSPAITIEFQGGEPTVNMAVIRYMVEEGRRRAAATGKETTFSIVTNMTYMNDENMMYLIGNDVRVCTSLDGPREVHDANRKMRGGASYDLVVSWMDKFNAEYRRRGQDPRLYHVDALMTTTRTSLTNARAIVDEYVRRGITVLHLRPLDPYGFATRTARAIGYTMDEFLAFYRETTDYIIELNKKGTEVVERMSSIFLTKILTARDPNYLDLRSPCGAAIGQLAYNYDGSVYTCDEGRMLAAEGDQLFQIGNARRDPYSTVIAHPTVRAMAEASILDGQPLCEDCAYKPYCGTCPVFNYREQGDIFGKMPSNGHCQMTMYVQDYLFTHLASGDKDVLEIFTRWTKNKFNQSVFD